MTQMAFVPLFVPISVQLPFSFREMKEHHRTNGKELQQKHHITETSQRVNQTRITHKRRIHQTAGCWTLSLTRERFNWFVLFSARCLFAQMYNAITRMRQTAMAMVKIVITTTNHSSQQSLQVDQNPSTSYTHTHLPAQWKSSNSSGTPFSMCETEARIKH